MKEKRRYPRIGRRLPLRLVTDKGVKIDLDCINISAGGIYLLISRLVGASPRSRLTLYLSKDLPPITCQGKLVRVDLTDSPRRYNWAFRLEKITPADRRRLKEYVEKRGQATF